MHRIFIGFDSNETVAFHVLANSIMRHASWPVQITPLMLSQLPLLRPADSRQSTEFSFSRFLVPWLCGFKGQALFIDCDMLCRADIDELFSIADGAAVSVVKHAYRPKNENKFLDQQQTAYVRKNWSSVMIFNCDLCRALTPEYVDTASGLDLHQFKWIDDDYIGELPAEWNHLVGEFDPNPDAKLVHFTLGTPCFRKYATCEFSNEWYEERRLLLDYNRMGEFSLPAREAA